MRSSPPSRVVSRPNSLPLPFRTPATQAKPRCLTSLGGHDGAIWQRNTSNWSTYIIWRTLIRIWLTSFEKPNISFRKPILSLETQITPLGNQISSPVQVLNLPIAYWTMLAFHLVLLDHWHHSHSLASYRVNFCVHISSVTLYLIKGLLYQETERWENLLEKGPRTRKPFAAHSRVVSLFLPHRLWILI